jgi:hypothetical protein
VKIARFDATQICILIDFWVCQLFVGFSSSADAFVTMTNGFLWSAFFSAVEEMKFLHRFMHKSFANFAKFFNYYVSTESKANAQHAKNKQATQKM